VTREPFEHQGRLTDLATNRKLTDDLGLPPLDAKEDRVMLCGSPGLLTDMRAILGNMGFSEGSTTSPGDYVIERAFVDK
jgi:ferredoxin--NADP+ reductase